MTEYVRSEVRVDRITALLIEEIAEMSGASVEDVASVMFAMMMRREFPASVKAQTPAVKEQHESEGG